MIANHSSYERELLKPLFETNKYDVVIMKSILEGDLGTAYSNDISNLTVSRLDSGAYTIL